MSTITNVKTLSPEEQVLLYFWNERENVTLPELEKVFSPESRVYGVVPRDELSKIMETLVNDKIIREAGGTRGSYDLTERGEEYIVKKFPELRETKHQVCVKSRCYVFCFFLW